QPTEKTVPDAQARIGAPSGAKMSSPWCHPPETSPRNAPNVSMNDDGPYTGNTWPPGVFSGGVICGGWRNGISPGAGSGAAPFAFAPFFVFGVFAVVGVTGVGGEASAATSA